MATARKKRLERQTQKSNNAQVDRLKQLLSAARPGSAVSRELERRITELKHGSRN